MIRFFSALIKYKAFVVAGILTLILSSMIYSRISILQTGDEITLLSRPVDPRDLFRGNYVTMTYDINNLNSCKVEIKDDFSRRQPVFVQLEEGDKGYWKAVSVSAHPLEPTKTTIILSGYSRSNYTIPKKKVLLNSQDRPMENCRHLYVRYGLEKYFAPKKRAKELENMRRGRGSSLASDQIREMNKKMMTYRKKIRDLYQKNTGQHRQGLTVRIKPNDPQIRLLQTKLKDLREKIRELRDSARAQVAVIVRVSKTGEGAISGLMIDGKKVYDEPLL